MSAYTCRLKYSLNSKAVYYRAVLLMFMKKAEWKVHETNLDMWFNEMRSIKKSLSEHLHVFSYH